LALGFWLLLFGAFLSTLSLPIPMTHDHVRKPIAAMTAMTRDPGDLPRFPMNFLLPAGYYLVERFAPMQEWFCREIL
jgi:hypothetical protein